MKFFAAVGSKDELGATIVMPPYRVLCSYHYWKSKIELIKECLEKGYEVFVDSGAFSAKSLGKEIDIDAYCNFIIETGVTMYAGLDVIGDASATMKNVHYMENRYGLKPIPTFHMGSELTELYPLMKYSYIALGGLVFSPGVIQHCDEVWHYILSNNPNLRVHGFGVTSLDIMKRYPWTSVDSSSYKSCRRFGRQGILYNGLEFETIKEDEYIKLLEEMGHKNVNGLTNKERYHLYDFYSCQSYKMYAAHLGELNKIKKFNYLTAQQKLF